MTRLPIPFANPTTYAGHSGVDYGERRGTPFPSSGPGIVTWLGTNAKGGNFIWVQYDDIEPRVGYHHMDSHDGCPRVGERFEYGDRLGYVGNSGRSFGPHLHSEVDGHRTTDGYWKYFDPTEVVGSASGAGSANNSKMDTSEDDDMKFLYVKASGKNKAFWALLNTHTGKYATVPDQERANDRATVWGPARKVTRQEFLNAVAEIKATL